MHFSPLSCFMVSMASERTSVSFESTVEKRAGKQVVVVKKTTTVTPISNRGTEWNKQQIRSETTIIPVDEARDLLTSLTDAFFYALDGVPEYETERLELTNAHGLLSKHYSVAEAEERARELQDQYDTSDFDKLVIYWAGRLDAAVVASVVVRGA